MSDVGVRMRVSERELQQVEGLGLKVYLLLGLGKRLLKLLLGLGKRLLLLRLVQALKFREISVR